MIADEGPQQYKDWNLMCNKGLSILSILQDEEIQKHSSELLKN